MATMSFMDEMKDKASRIIPSAYSEILEETTSDVLLTPNFQNIVFLCDSANANPENITDIVRAVRRRMDNKSAKVQFFTIQVLDSLVKNCGLNVHLEIADTKGLLHDLFLVATRKQARDGDKEAITAALTLILNMSLWFSGHSEEKVKVLQDLADHVRRSIGPNAFEGIEPDTSVQLRRAAAASSAQRQTAAARRQRRQEEEYLRLQREHAMSAGARPQVVKAIPLIIPTEEEVSGMLDACLLLAECLNTAESQGTPVVGDDVIGNVATQVRRDHRNLAMILSSGAEIPNMDVLFSVTDSQTSIIQRLSDSVKRERGQFQEQHQQEQRSSAGHLSRETSHESVGNATQQPQSPATPPSIQSTTAATAPPVPPIQASAKSGAHGTSQDGHGRRHIRQAEDVEDYEVEMEVTPKLPPPASAIPTMDDLFGGSAPTTTAATSSSPPPPPAPGASTAFPAPSQSVDHHVATPATMTHDEGQVATAAGTSINDDEGDEFDNFLSSRLRK